jgi:lysylphosphatidylglycerol synthetase-like protein (DUF2156 family)
VSRLCADLDVRLPYLKQYGGGCMAYSTLAEGVEAFVAPGLGYVAYARQRLFGERVFVLADPIAPPERWGEILDLFLARYASAVFVQISERAATLLRERNRVVNELGTETDIDVQAFTLSWVKRKSVTYMCSVARRAQPVLREIPAAKAPRARLQAISDEWIGTRVATRREMAFMTRPAVFEDEPGVRKLYAFVDDELIGYAFFSPMYANGAVVGYHFDIHRQIAEDPAARKGKEAEASTGGTRIPELLAKGIRGSPRGLSYWILVEAMKMFKAEGVRTLSLGLSPFHDVNDTAVGFSPFTRWLFRASYTKLGWIYNSTGNADFKQRWKGTTRKVYVALESRYPVLDLIAVYRLSGLL